jgi:hypothetical protein
MAVMNDTGDFLPRDSAMKRRATQKNRKQSLRQFKQDWMRARWVWRA